ncbi:F0F1 ATP synthase subunit B [Coxiella endosymbiont of Amblyomma americanum]|uniref:F0F1 ATP synthase subunit B n=1 Tax=Coxiella endosymbiont of Amblyomma americanum TaxID=325775 RepID=UPI0005804D94|nr:F0F1 ATP synthase subunit B [Coxiella endosymbiont of Amblyomma americanum]AJC50163.1 ATP synthase subunit B [Coxiella endosymbiont of Amblyomma americanum]AUJ58522.1 F0F1 ATP synthase subunit B [Coxiella-like endosymbiont of Amblyomma americanum]
MDINASLIIQMLVFAIFIVLTMKFVWPSVMQALEKRRKNIADGLAAAEKGYKKLKLSEKKEKESLTRTKAQAMKIIEQAHQRANYIILVAKSKAREERTQLLQLAKNDIDQEYNTVKIKLLKQVSDIVVESTQKILQREVNKASHDRLLDELISDI